MSSVTTLSSMAFLSEEELDAILEESRKDVEEAIKFAQDSPIPRSESLLEDVFAD